LIHLPGQPVPEGGQALYVIDRHGRKLRVGWFPLPGGVARRASVLICPGRTEFIEKYLETVADCHARGLDAMVMDWPGQGLSQRLTPDPLIGHVDDFSDMADALADAVATLGDKLSPRRVLLCHSMGGCIGLMAIVEGKVALDAAAFSAPMWGIRSTIPALKRIAGAMGRFGQGRKMAHKPFPPETFETNVVTHDQARWAVQAGLIGLDPRLALGPVSWGFLRAAYKAFGAFARKGAIEAIKVPVLVVTAEQEVLVDNAAHQAICARLPHVEHITVMGARHEVLMEVDGARAQFFDGFDRLLGRAGLA